MRLEDLKIENISQYLIERNSVEFIDFNELFRLIKNHKRLDFGIDDYGEMQIYLYDIENKIFICIRWFYDKQKNKSFLEKTIYDDNYIYQEIDREDYICETLEKTLNNQETMKKILMILANQIYTMEREDFEILNEIKLEDKNG